MDGLIKLFIGTGILVLGLGFLAWLIADSADANIQSEVTRTCLVHQAEEKNVGPRVNSYCTCTGNMTSNKANILLRFLHQIEVVTIKSPYNISKKLGEETHTACNAILGAT